MSKRTQTKKFNFLLEVKDSVPTDEDIKWRFKRVYDMFQLKVKKSFIEEYLILVPTEGDPNIYQFYISLSEQKQPVDYCYFKNQLNLGGQCFTNNGFEVLVSTYDGC